MVEKLNNLIKLIKKMNSVIVAFSGGVDSTFLLKVSKDVLKNKVLAVTADSEVQSEIEMVEVKKLASELNAEHLIVRTDEIQNKKYSSNPPDRCYHCKTILFSKLKEVAKEKKILFIIEGSNADDANDYRPGLRAIYELSIRSPLKEVGLTKDEIRALSKNMGLKTWDKPALACLASRIPYGTEITIEKLRRVDEAEIYLRMKGVRQVRVRDHGDIARIEIAQNEFDLLSQNGLKSEVTSRFKELGYLYVTIDLEGYNSGSMNRVLKANG